MQDPSTQLTLHPGVGVKSLARHAGMGSDGSLRPWCFRGCCNLVLSLKECQSWFWGGRQSGRVGCRSWGAGGLGDFLLIASCRNQELPEA